MEQDLIKRVLGAYAIEYKTILPAQKGYRNSSYPIILSDSQTANLILYKNEPGMEVRIKRANTVSDFLASRDFPARRTFDKRIICLESPQRTSYGSLYIYLPGQTIAWEAYTKDHLKLLGMVMSHMHAALKTGPTVENKVTDEYAAIIGRMQRYFSQPSVQKALQQKLGLVLRLEVLDQSATLLHLVGRLPHQQTLHMDFVRGNLLFNEAHELSQYKVGKVAMTGIIDFEKTASGHPLFDIARTLAFLLVDCLYKSEQKIRKYFLMSGYNKRGLVAFKNIHILHKNQQVDLLEELVNLFLVYDFYKFLCHNPYEFLGQNQHFVRTRDILIARNMVKYTN